MLAADRVLAARNCLWRTVLDAIVEEPAFSLVARESVGFLEVLACDLHVAAS